MADQESAPAKQTKAGIALLGFRGKDKRAKILVFWKSFLKTPNNLKAVRRAGTKHYQKMIEAACRELSLNPEIPSDRELAFGIWATILFPDASGDALSRFPGRGRPREWDDKAITQFRRDIIKVCPNVDKSARQIATLLQERFPKYKHAVLETLTWRVKLAFRAKISFG
jgi:hypothetical protein